MQQRVSVIGMDLSLIPSVSQSVCPKSVLWQHSWLDLDAVWVVSEVGWGMDVLDGDGDRRREESVLGVNLGHPIVTTGDFVA